jgi:uncharacterized membrane protein YkvA (DUF1232 family)
MENFNKYDRHYSDNGFWAIIRKHGNNIPFLRDALAMFFCLKDPTTPAWVKALIVGALGYFILPIDAIPDVFPVFGWLDDAGVIAGVMYVIYAHIKPEHWRMADDALGNESVQVPAE